MTFKDYMRGLLAAFVTTAISMYLHTLLPTMDMSLVWMDMLYEYGTAAAAYLSILIFMRKWEERVFYSFKDDVAMFSVGTCFSVLFLVSVVIWTDKDWLLNLDPYFFSGFNFMTMALLNIAYKPKNR